MVRIKLTPTVAERLEAFIRSGTSAVRSDHWLRYGKLNQVRIDGNYAVVSAGPGFDSEYELNFRPPTLRERATWVWHSLRGRNDLRRHRDAYRKVWAEPPARAISPHEIIAGHYMRSIASHRACSYLEVGAGTGYLAALVHRTWAGKITIIDLPEILPLGFLYLHSLFPHVPFALPNEAGPATFTFLTSGESVADDSIDMAVNTASLGEMSHQQIAYYFRLFRRALEPGGLFFTVNREEKWMDGEPIRFREYPWSPDDVDLLYEPSQLHAITQPQNPMLVRICRLAKSSPTRN